MDSLDIISTFSGCEELERLLPLIKDVAIIEYDGKNIDFSEAVKHYLHDKGLPDDIVKRIVLLGETNVKKKANNFMISKLFPHASISAVDKTWRRVIPEELEIHCSLVFHNGCSALISEDTFDDVLDADGNAFKIMVNGTRSAYYVCLLNGDNDAFSSLYSLKSNLRLDDFKLKEVKPAPSKSGYCADKLGYLTSCVESLVAKDAFFQAIDDAEQGCEECDQCANYSPYKRCPEAQRIVARYYREGLFVPQSDVIAHQWEVKASRQGLMSATIQVADDYREGLGCNQDIDKALQIYSRYAMLSGNAHCVDQIMNIAEAEQSGSAVVAVPYIAQRAAAGDDEMLVKLCDAFRNGALGLPIDPVQQKEWTAKGAERGIPRCMLAMAERCEAEGDWKGAYQWYVKVSEKVPELVDKDKLDEAEIKMLTNGASADEVAKIGRNYLYGYFGLPRDTHLAYRCLTYASDSGVAYATGLLGVMYLRGWEVEVDEEMGISLQETAAGVGDLLSMDRLTTLHHDARCCYHDGLKWERQLVEQIEKGIADGNPFAYYLKGRYIYNGYLYSNNLTDAIRCMEKAAEADIPQAQFLLAEMYGSDESGEPSYLWKNWLKKAAENGHYEAQGVCGMLMFDSYSRGAHDKVMFAYLKNAYERGYEEVYWYLAQCYMNGYGTGVDKALAYPLYQKAAENGIELAQERLCKAYFRGDGPLQKDYTLCAKWGEEAIGQGNRQIRFETAYSCAEIGKRERAKELYLELSNEGVAVAMNNYACLLGDVNEEFEWFMKAAEHGNDYGMWNAGKNYRDGRGTDKNTTKAIEYLTMAANNGNVGAMLDLADIYRSGNGIDADGNLAIHWYERAAEAGKTEALLKIADIYLDGKIAGQDADKAIAYLKKADGEGDTEAEYKLATIYEYGDGIPKDLHRAISWYRKAANKKHLDAQRALKRLRTNWLGADGKVTNVPDDEIDGAIPNIY